MDRPDRPPRAVFCLQRIGLRIGPRIGRISQADKLAFKCRYLVGSQWKHALYI